MSRQALVAAFARPENALRAATRARAAGYRDIDVISPFALTGTEEALDLPPSRVRPVMLAAAVAGGAAAFALQSWSAVLDYPINVGGRALFSWPAFMLATFEVAVLAAAVAGFAAMLISGGLPRLHHPLLAVEGIERATQDRFFVVLGGGDRDFDPAAAKRLLTRMEPLFVREWTS